MLPIIPESENPAPVVRPRAPTPTHLLVILFIIAGIVAGIVTAGAACVVAYGIDLLDNRNPGNGRSLQQVYVHDSSFGGIIPGSCAGWSGGMLLWIVASFWPAARHAIRSASLCASLAGCLGLLVLSGMIAGQSTNRIDVLLTCLALAAAVALGALYGFLVAIFTRGMERGLAILNRSDGHDISRSDSANAKRG